MKPKKIKTKKIEIEMFLDLWHPTIDLIPSC